MNYDEIVKKLRSGGLFPHEASEALLQLAGDYAYLSSQLIGVLMQKPVRWNELRKEQKSDTATERAWQATEQGLNETEIRLKLKAQEKLMSALKTKISVDSGEARNQF